MKKLSAVYVKWDDASSRSSWEDLDDYDPKQYIAETIGFLVKEDEKRVIIAGTVCKDHNRGSDFTTIPRGMILEMHKIRSKHL